MHLLQQDNWSTISELVQRISLVKYYNLSFFFQIVGILYFGLFFCFSEFFCCFQCWDFTCDWLSDSVSLLLRNAFLSFYQFFFSDMSCPRISFLLSFLLSFFLISMYSCVLFGFHIKRSASLLFVVWFYCCSYVFFLWFLFLFLLESMLVAGYIPLYPYCFYTLFL